MRTSVRCSLAEFLHKLDRSVVTAISAPPANQTWLSVISRSVFTSDKNENAAFLLWIIFFFSSFLGLFDWKKDKKFFARFEEPVSSERGSPPDDGELTSLLQTCPCSCHFFTPIAS